LDINQKIQIMATSIAIVTGANKGIGLAIVQSLAEKLPADKWHIYLTSRDVPRGEEALKKLHDSGHSHVHFHQLDITDEASVVTFKKFIQEKYPAGINILINNAGMGFPQEWLTVEKPVPFKEVLETTMKTNFWSLYTVHKHLTPLLAKDARVVNLASTMGIWAMKEIAAPLRDKAVALKTLDQLADFTREYENAALEKEGKDFGYPTNVYGMSKFFEIPFTKIQALEFEKDPRNIIVNCCCPGYVATDLNSNKGYLTVQEGAQTPVYLALESDNNIKGQFLTNLKVYDWETAHLNDEHNQPAGGIKLD